LHPKEGLFFVNTMISVEAPLAEERAIASRAGFSQDWRHGSYSARSKSKMVSRFHTKKPAGINRVGRKRCSALRLR
jgi:hypothetical protein